MRYTLIIAKLALPLAPAPILGSSPQPWGASGSDLRGLGMDPLLIGLVPFTIGKPGVYTQQIWLFVPAKYPFIHRNYASINWNLAAD